MAIRIHRSSGNVFADIGFPREQAAHLLIRSDLMFQATALIKERGLTQKQAAKALGVTQPRGDLSFFWTRGPRKTVTASVSASGLLSFAALHGHRRLHGSEYLIGGPPTSLTLALRQLYADEA